MASTSTLRPGPCHSATRRGRTCTYEYDPSGHVTLVDCTDARTTWTWNGDAVLGIAESNGTTWTFDAQHVTATGDTTLVYDRASFAFLPLLGIRVSSPKADLGLASQGSKTYAWSPSAGGLTRRSSTNEIVVYQIDALGHVTSIMPGPATALDPGAFTFRYDGDRLVSSSVVSGVVASGTTFTYDRGGNLVEEDDSAAEDVMRESSESAYDYTCW